MPNNGISFQLRGLPAEALTRTRPRLFLFQNASKSMRTCMRQSTLPSPRLALGSLSRSPSSPSAEKERSTITSDARMLSNASTTTARWRPSEHVWRIQSHRSTGAFVAGIEALLQGYRETALEKGGAAQTSESPFEAREHDKSSPGIVFVNPSLDAKCTPMFEAFRCHARS